MGFFDKLVQTARVKSPWLLHYDTGSCNGCDIEILACLTPMYDVERFGIVNVGNPKHADILVVTGGLNLRSERVVKNLYDQMPEPKAVLAIGACACGGGVLQECYNVKKGIDNAIPVDVYVYGCAARPEAIIDGVVQALGKLNEKRAAKGLPAVTKPKLVTDQQQSVAVGATE
jgi:ech hydrogenase subunit C